jgi:protein arginine N-methyltransferase 1
MYSIGQFGTMIADSVRMGAFNSALERAIKPGSIVLDIGAGTGIFSLLACKYGAVRVYAVEPDSSLQIAKTCARQNGCEDRIRFIQDLSTAIQLPEQVDVLVSDLRGILPLFQSHLPSIIDARKRFLRSGGIQIPGRDVVKMVPVEVPNVYTKKIAGHHPNAYGVNLEHASNYACNIRRRVGLKADCMLSEPRCWSTFDYSTIESIHHSQSMTWTVARNGICHGLAGWFDAELFDGIGYSNAPGMPETIYGQMFFPWLRPVPVKVGDRIKVVVHANLLKDDYLWRWESQIFQAETPDRVHAEFRQSDFLGTVRLTPNLRKRAGSYVPRLKASVQIERQILNWMDGTASVQDIARRVFESFPEQFKNQQEAFDRVSAISGSHSE